MYVGNYDYQTTIAAGCNDNNRPNTKAKYDCRDDSYKFVIHLNGTPRSGVAYRGNEGALLPSFPSLYQACRSWRMDRWTNHRAA